MEYITESISGKLKSKGGLMMTGIGLMVSFVIVFAAGALFGKSNLNAWLSE